MIVFFSTAFANYFVGVFPFWPQSVVLCLIFALSYAMLDHSIFWLFDKITTWMRREVPRLKVPKNYDQSFRILEYCLKKGLDVKLLSSSSGGTNLVIERGNFYKVITDYVEGTDEKTVESSYQYMVANVDKFIKEYEERKAELDA